MSDARQDTVAMDWLRLGTIVDALLRRAAASKDAAAIAAAKDRASAATNRTPQTQQAIHG